ncbi:RNA recognition motif domain containing protein [Babesia caballi]|uniref:peptidylprolyl isomerase n=1 Tax=Babesia caballi TaxID=5871 RepID=A0AAV4LSZ2_BABCB|nr:RNA recognition motif domain containing protein [Babesia caballi]
MDDSSTTDDRKLLVREFLDLEELQAREAKSRAVVLEILGDIPDADVAPPKNVLFVCKLNPVTEQDDLKLIFSRFGPVRSCDVIRDYKTGDSLQYAFVEFETEDACNDAYFKMQNVLIDDRRIHVDFCQSVSGFWKRFKDNGSFTRTGNGGSSRSKNAEAGTTPRQPHLSPSGSGATGHPSHRPRRSVSGETRDREFDAIRQHNRAGDSHYRSYARKRSVDRRSRSPQRLDPSRDRHRDRSVDKRRRVMRDRHRDSHHDSRSHRGRERYSERPRHRSGHRRRSHDRSRSRSPGSRRRHRRSRSYD